MYCCFAFFVCKGNDTHARFLGAMEWAWSKEMLTQTEPLSNQSEHVYRHYTHLSLPSSPSAWSSLAMEGAGRTSCSRIPRRESSRVLKRWPRCPGTGPEPPPGSERLEESCCTNKERLLSWASRLRKQEGQVGHLGKLSQWPRLQESQRSPVTPGRHKHAPVLCSQLAVPRGSHWQAGGRMGEREGERGG